MNTLPNDIARCNGMWIEDGEHSSWREGCENCMRRTAPRDGYESFIMPPPIIAFWCEYLIEPPLKKNKKKCRQRKRIRYNDRAMTADKPYTSIREVEAAHRAKLDELRAQVEELIANEERIAAQLRAELAELKGGDK